jgi:hypothetical protein
MEEEVEEEEVEEEVEGLPLTRCFKAGHPSVNLSRQRQSQALVRLIFFADPWMPSVSQAAPLTPTLILILPLNPLAAL